MTDTTAEAQLQVVEGEVAADVVTPAPEVAPAPEPAPASAQLKVKTKKLTVERKEDDQGAAQVRQDGETRTETDTAPVQMAVVTQVPREIEELEFPSMKIERIRY